MRLIILFLITLILIFSSLDLLAIEKAERISDRETIESLVELKASQMAMERRFDGIFVSFLTSKK